MLCRFRDQLCIFIIVAVYAVFIGIRRLDSDRAAQRQNITQTLAQVSIIGYGLRKDIRCTGKRCIRIGHLKLRIHKGFCFCGGICFIVLLHNQVRKRLQSARFCNGCLRLTLLFIRTINILNFNERLRRRDRFGKLRGHLFECCDRIGDLLLALFQLPQIIQAVIQRMKRLVIQRAGLFLSVSCNERDGLAVVEQRNRVCNLFFSKLEFFCKLF